MSKKIKIYGEFYNDTPGGFVASSDQIKDNTSGKSQETINSELYQKNAPKTKYLVCYTGSDVAEKVIEFPGFVLDSEVRLLIQMVNPNVAANPTLNINNTGAKSIYYNGKLISTENEWKENEILDAYYDGEKYNLTSYTKIIDTLDNIIEYLKTSTDYLDWLEIKTGIRPPHNEIWYTSINGETIEPDMGANIISNTYENGKGIIKLSSDVESLEDSVFSYCNSLTSINLPNSVESIGESAFEECTGLTSINIPKSVGSIGNYAFFDCTGLASITSLNTTPPTLSGSAFGGTNNCPIYVPSGSVEAYKTAWSTYASRIQAIQ